MSIDTKELKERIYALGADLDTAQHADHEETIRALVAAADRLSELEAELASVRTDRYESRATTHADVCWSWGPAHYECAVREIEQLASELQEWRNRAQDKTRLWRQAMDDLDAARSEADRLRAKLAVRNCELDAARAEALELRGNIAATR